MDANEMDKKQMDISMSKDSHESDGRPRRKTLKGNIASGHDHDVVEMSGYLQKRRGGFGRHMPNAWQIRYFTLKDGIMYYYEDNGPDSRPRGKIDLKSENCDFMNGLVFEGAPTPYTMQIIPGGWDEKWKLCATTKEDMELWVAAIMRHITDETKRKPAAINLKSYVSDDDEDDDAEAEEDQGPHLKLHGVPVSGGNSIMSSSTEAPGQGSGAGASHDRFTPPTTPQAPPNTPAGSVSSTPQHPSNGNQSTTAGAIAAAVTGVATSATAAVSAAAEVATTAATGTSGAAAAGTAAGGAGVGSSGKPKSKRRLKLQSDASGESDEMEYITALVIVNLCLLFAHTASHILLTLLYFLILNIVVARTLQLRSSRLTQQHQSLTVAHNAALKTMQESHHQAIQALIQKSMEASAAQANGNGGPAPMELMTLDALITGKDEEEVAEAKPSGPPPPGTTVPQIINGMPPDVPNHSWNICDHSTFNVRVGPDYSKYKRKGPSAKALYEPFAVDTFCAKNRIDHVAQHIKLENTDHIDTHNEFVPPLLLVQIQLPSDAPPLFETIEDGPGWAIVMYFRITQDTCDQLKDLSTASPAVKLFAKYCQFAEKDPAWRARFKVINFCSNLEEMGVPSVIMSYNAKPVLIRRTGSVFRGGGTNTSITNGGSPSGGSKYLEIDIHVHKFANLAKKSIHALSSRCSLMYMQIGFVIEGRTDEELPETLFACVGVNRPEEDKAEFLFDPPEEE